MGAYNLFAACFYTENSCLEQQADLDVLKANNPAKHPTLHNEANGQSENEANGQSEKCCSRNGICSHGVLRDGKPNSDSKMIRKVFYITLIESKWDIMIILLQFGFLLIL